MRQLASFDIGDVAGVGDAIRAIGPRDTAMEHAAQRIADLLYEELGDGDRPACALVRVYKTHPFGGLPDELQEYAAAAAGHALAPEVRCLCLLGTRGDRAEWNDRHGSVGHRAIPLASEQMVERLPMVARLIEQLGVDVAAVIRPEAAPVRELSRRQYDVFHVEEAVGSPFLPAQDFVAAHGIRSAVGFGGLLHTGDFYAVVLFSKVRLSSEVAESLKLASLAVRVPLMRFLLGRVFAQQ